LKASPCRRRHRRPPRRQPTAEIQVRRLCPTSATVGRTLSAVRVAVGGRRASSSAPPRRPRCRPRRCTVLTDAGRAPVAGVVGVGRRPGVPSRSNCNSDAVGPSTTPSPQQPPSNRPTRPGRRWTRCPTTTTSGRTTTRRRRWTWLRRPWWPVRD